MRHNFKIFLVAVAISLSSWAGTGDARTLKVASWNMEHLADTDGEGCRPRSQADYEALKRHAERLDADVIAVQEVENEQALARVFDPSQWSLEVSHRPDQGEARECYGHPGKYIITQRTGFVIKKPLRYTRNPDVADLDVNHNNRLRYGVDITLEAGTPPSPALDPSQDWLPRQTTKQQQQQLHHAVPAGQSVEGLGEQTRRRSNPLRDPGGLQPPSPGGGGLLDGVGCSRGDPGRDLTFPVGQDTVAHCQAKYPEFIDFLVFDPRSLGFVRKGTFQELVYSGKPASDHCPVAIGLAIPDLAALKPGKGGISTGLKWYRRSAEFPLIARYIYAQATRRIDAIKADWRGSADWAVSTDADETILDNSLGLGYVPERWKQWVKRGAARAVPGAIAFLNHVLQACDHHQPWQRA